MKKLFHYLSVFAIAALTLTGCDDVPEPYNQPSITPEESAAGSGTATDPYNVAAALEKIQALSNDTTDVIYVKGVVMDTPEIETDRFGNANFNITDDGNNKLYIFQTYYLGNRKFTTNDKLAIGDTVVVCGRFFNFRGNTPETTGKGTSYIYSLNGKNNGGDTPTPTPGGEAKGDGTQANPFNATGANAKASTLADGEKLENIYVSGIICEVGDFNSKYGELNYYISEDGTTTGDKFYVYNGYGKDGAQFSSANDLKVGQKVTVVGTLINFKGNTPEFQYGSKIVSIDGDDTPTEPTGLNESFATSQGGFTIQDIQLPEGSTYVWKYDDGQKYMKASGYVARKNRPSQSRLVSPAFSLRGLTSATLTFDHTGRFFGDPKSDDIKVQASTDGQNWTTLTIPENEYPSGANWTFVTANVDLSAFAGQSKVYIAFLYTSTEKAAATWEIKNVVVK